METSKGATQADREAAADFRVAYSGRRGSASAAMYRSGLRDDSVVVQAFVRHRLAHTVDTTDGEREAVLKAAEPWANYHGDLPDYDHPLRPVFESGCTYAVELLAKELGVDDYSACDGTEEFDGDLGGTMVNIVLAAMPTNEHGDPLHPSELREALSRQPAAEADEVGRLLLADAFETLVYIFKCSLEEQVIRTAKEAADKIEGFLALNRADNAEGGLDLLDEGAAG